MAYNLYDPGHTTTCIDGVFPGGFAVNGAHLEGSVLALPTTALLWRAAEAPRDLTAESLALVTLLDEPPIRHLIIGLGNKRTTNALGASRGLAPAFVAAMRAKGISVEAMDSTAAAATFNFLNFEERPVAAALLAV